MENTLEKSGYNKNVAYLEDNVSVIGADCTELFVIVVLDESRKLEESLLRNYKVIILGAVGELASDSESEASQIATMLKLPSSISKSSPVRTGLLSLSEAA